MHHKIDWNTADFSAVAANKTEGLGDGDIIVFVSSFVCSFVCRWNYWWRRRLIVSAIQAAP